MTIYNLAGYLVDQLTFPISSLAKGCTSCSCMATLRPSIKMHAAVHMLM